MNSLELVEPAVAHRIGELRQFARVPVTRAEYGPPAVAEGAPAELARKVSEAGKTFGQIEAAKRQLNRDIDGAHTLQEIKPLAARVRQSAARERAFLEGVLAMRKEATSAAIASADRAAVARDKAMAALEKEIVRLVGPPPVEFWVQRTFQNFRVADAARVASAVIMESGRAFNGLAERAGALANWELAHEAL